MKYKEKYVIMPGIVERFLRYKRVIQGRSEKTVTEYGLDLRTFFRYLKAREKTPKPDTEALCDTDIADIDEAFINRITPVDIFEFMEYVSSERDNKSPSRARKLSSIRTFFKYCDVVERCIAQNPAINIESPKKKQSLPKYLSEEESLDLLKSVLNDESSNTKERDFCIMTLFLNCGMRLSELVGISLNDIDPKLRSLRVVGKGNKERIIYLNDACRAALSEYLLCRAKNPIEVKDKNALFLSRLHKRMSNKTVQWVVYKYLRQAGLEFKHFSTHKLRHTAATLMYQEGGVDVLALKEILGHAQLNTTQIYTHISNKSLQEAASKHPLAELTKKQLEEAGDGENGEDEEDAESGEEEGTES